LGKEPRRVEVSYDGYELQPRLIARLFPGGPVAAGTFLETVRFSSATDTNDAKIIDELADGTQLVEIGYLLSGAIPANLSIWIEIFVPNAVFESGDTRYHLTAADFDEKGEARLRIYSVPNSNGVTKVCHWIRPEYGEAAA